MEGVLLSGRVGCLDEWMFVCCTLNFISGDI